MLPLLPPSLASFIQELAFAFMLYQLENAPRGFDLDERKL